ncbi:MAG: hypothetical protein HY553_13480 [Elusimicrobia bacterium]|nr:hypothetical protein [Elusimicrobiota bacterium]
MKPGRLAGFLPSAAGLGALALYLLLPAARYNFDGVACAIAVELGEARHLVHGNHVAYGVLGWFAHWLLKLFGYQGPAVVSLQALSSALGALGVAGLCRLLLNFGVAPPLAAAAAAGLAVSRLYWTWSLEAQVYPLGGALLVWCAAELCRPKSSGAEPRWAGARWGYGDRRPRPFVAGLLHAGSVLGHVGNMMFAPAAWFCLPDASSRRRYALGLGAGLAAGYLAAVALFVRPEGLFELRSWLLGSTALSVDRRFMWLGAWSLERFGHWIRVSLELASGSSSTGLALWAAAGFGAWAARRERPQAVRLALWWLAGYALLYTNWQPMTVVYRYTDVPALWLLVACAVEAARAPTGLAGAGLACFVAYLGVWNAGASVVPGSRPELNADLQRALWLSRETPENAWVVVHATEQVYVPYFARRRPLNIRYFPDESSLQERVRALAKAGEPVYVVPEVLPEWAPRALEKFGWRQTSAHQGSRLYLIH